MSSTKFKKIKQKRIFILITILIVIGISTGLYLDKSKTQLQEKTKQSATQVDKNGKVLDCSKKIAQDKNSQISQNKNTINNNCLFLGCGDFF